MSECYCAKIEGGVVTQVIVCDNAEWASQRLGGEWVCMDQTLAAVGWLLVDGEVVPPPEPEPGPEPPLP